LSDRSNWGVKDKLAIMSKIHRPITILRDRPT
jgi:hypothetical protein